MIPVSIYTISPLFIRNMVDEPLRMTAAVTVLRLENFRSTNGPKVHIYVSLDKVASD